MAAPDSSASHEKTRQVVDTTIRLGLVALLAWLAVHIFAPFLALMIWAVVLAIALYPLNQKLAAPLGGSNGRAATVMVLVMVLVLGVPTVLLAVSLVEHAMSLYQGMAAGTLKVPSPKPGVADWPLVGPQLYESWQEAADNIKSFAGAHEEQLRELSRRAASTMAGGLLTILAFVGAFIIAGIMMAYARPGAESTQRIFNRICGPKIGPELHQLTVATVRSVAVGVIGVAFIQAVLLGIGFLLGDLPAPGLLALIALVLGVVQVPAALVVIPAIAWLWLKGDASTAINVAITIYLLLAGLADNVLKPMLLGRGLAVPMPVVLLGALGGMLTSGLIGLFVGAVILSVAYQIFMAWVNEGQPEDDTDSGTADSQTQ